MKKESCMKNLCKLKAMPRIAGIIAPVAVIGFSTAECGGINEKID
jgi:hypothetical protein